MQLLISTRTYNKILSCVNTIGYKQNTTPMCIVKLRVRRGSGATERAARASPSVKYPGVIEPSFASHPRLCTRIEDV